MFGERGGWVRGQAMAEGETCGNEYDRTFEIHLAGEVHVFDSFECAAHRLAPVCAHCGCRILGHGVQLRR